MTVYFGEKFISVDGVCQDTYDEVLGFKTAEIIFRDKFDEVDISYFIEKELYNIYPTQITYGLYIKDNLPQEKSDWYGLNVKTPRYIYNKETE